MDLPAFLRSTEVIRTIRPYCHQHVVDFIEVVLAAGPTPLKVETLANRLRVHRRALEQRLAGAGGPRPIQLIAWCRLLKAADLLEQDNWTVESIAEACGYCSAGALRKAAIRRRLPIRRLRTERGFATAVLSFAEALRLSREAHRACKKVRRNRGSDDK